MSQIASMTWAILNDRDQSTWAIQVHKKGVESKVEQLELKLELPYGIPTSQAVV